MNDITFARNLSSVMLDNKYDRFVKNRRTGKLNTRALYKIDVSSRLFKKKEARKNKHYAVSLVVDGSGSMSSGKDSKTDIACESARKLSFHLSRMGIPHNIVSFAMHAEEVKKFDATYDPDIALKLRGEVGWGKEATELYRNFFWDRSQYIKSKTGKDIHPFLKETKGHEENYRYMTELETARIKYYNVSSPSINSDAEALKFAREKILKQEGKKILIYLSDGSPCPMNSEFESPINAGYAQTDFKLKAEVSTTLKRGVELYAIGIQDSGVNHYYPPKRTCVIANLDALYPHIIKLIRINLKRG